MMGPILISKLVSPTGCSKPTPCRRTTCDKWTHKREKTIFVVMQEAGLLPDAQWDIAVRFGRPTQVGKAGSSTLLAP